MTHVTRALPPQISEKRLDCMIVVGFFLNKCYKDYVDLYIFVAKSMRRESAAI